MATLVTGIAGFIGSHAAKKLLDNGYDVVGLDNFNPYYSPEFKQQRLSNVLADYNINIYNQDLVDLEGLIRVFEENNIDSICHLAAQAGVRYSIENPDIYVNSNIIGTHHLLEVAKNKEVAKFVYASSSSVYGGNDKVPFSETDKVENPVSLYAATKKYNELEAHAYHHLYGINCFGLRFFTVYGPWGRPDMAYFKFADLMSRGEVIDVYNQGKHVRDFTYIDDITDGILEALDRCQGYEIFNLGNDKPVELERFIDIMEKTMGVTAQRNYLPMQPGDVLETWANIDKAKSILNYDPKINIEEGIARFVDWFKNYETTL